MVDIDEETFVETIQQRAPRAVAFEQNDGVGRWNAIGLMTRSAKGRF